MVVRRFPNLHQKEPHTPPIPPCRPPGLPADLSALACIRAAGYHTQTTPTSLTTSIAITGSATNTRTRTPGCPRLSGAAADFGYTISTHLRRLADWSGLNLCLHESNRQRTHRVLYYRMRA
ncbi:hypothetical protein AURDEDRAFT_109395 [Auricularia subglabra TFB-10046 SS5]|uniref:Uncharacterized protein n=1 Tax=Auricularia subglabra (strain TFB-10046 / SS5) TaxID=717982 RepID=J0WLA4_AURST|nr:hypothetical protein AURDEDRAFT_109395 [Auricularia subglabra TFB-10046 SS5]